MKHPDDVSQDTLPLQVGGNHRALALSLNEAAVFKGGSKQAV